jgi:uncharacterized C2H2 Zn-finger protein
MPMITAWKCNTTGDIFEYKSDYTKHLRKLAAQKAAATKRRHRIESFKESVKSLYLLTSFENIAVWLIDNQEMITDYFHFVYNENRPKCVINKLTFDRMRFNSECSNSHNAPLGKLTNWGGKNSPDVPLSYPGWRGNIIIEYIGDSWRISDMLRFIGICTGSGGGGSNRLHYDVTLWADDFIELRRMVVLAKLSGEKY